LSLFYPSACGACKRYIKDFKYFYVCAECFAFIKYVDSFGCRTCGKTLVSEDVEQCRECRERENYFSRVKAAGIYDGAMKEIIHLIKFSGRRKLVKLAAELLLERTGKEYFSGFDALVPVPLSKKSMEERGYNQSALVAEILSKKTGLELLFAADKVKETDPQNKLTRKERLTNLRGAFRANRDLRGKKVLVVDDVYTTGSTMNEMAKVLKKAGAEKVAGLVIARSV